MRPNDFSINLLALPEIFPAKHIYRENRHRAADHDHIRTERPNLRWKELMLKIDLVHHIAHDAGEKSPASSARKAATSDIDIKVKSPDQLAFDCFGNRQWPDANIWQVKLWIAYSGVLDTAQDYNRDPTAAALTDMVKAQTAFTDTHERCRLAVNAWDAKNAAAQHLSVSGGLPTAQQHYGPPLHDLLHQHPDNR